MKKNNSRNGIQTISFYKKTILGTQYQHHQYLLSTLSLMMAAIFLSLCFWSCDNNAIEYEIPSIEKNDKNYEGVYPKSQHATRSSDYGFWESWKYLKLKNGDEVPTPWNEQYTISSAPHDILEDTKYEDGWDLIFYILDNSSDGYHKNSPYLIFHNRYTGILKVFCYLSDDSFHLNNNGIWKISTSQPSSLFAFQSNPVGLVSEKQVKTYYVNNITNHESKGFNKGWNCFQIELAYDPSQSGMLLIDSRCRNTAQISLTGDIEADTSGLITISESKDNYQKGIANIAGKEAGSWIADKIKNKTILGIPTSIVSEGVKAMVTSGAGSIIGAVTGLFKKDNSSKSIQLTTNGTFTSNGSIVFETPTGIDPLQINLSPSMVGRLGVWGLSAEPTLLFSPYALLKSPQSVTNGYSKEYTVNISNDKTARASILLNPELSKYITSNAVLTDFYLTDHYTRRNIWGSIGVTGRSPQVGDKVYDKLFKPKFYIMADVSFKDEGNDYIPIDEFEAPMEVFIPNVPNGPNGAIPNFIYHSSYLATVGVVLKLPNGSEACSYHRCIPKIDWNYSEYNNGLYWYFYPCEPVVRYNSKSFDVQTINDTETAIETRQE